MTTQTQIRKTTKQYEIDERRKQVAIMAAQGMTEMEIGRILGVDNSTISLDIKALKLISQQFIYDITKSDFAYYYRQNLELVKMVLRKQWEIASKEEPIEDSDLRRAKLLTDVLLTIETLNQHYEGAKHMHRTPEEALLYDEDRLGKRPEAPKPKPKLEVHSKEEELEGLEADLAQWYDNFNDSKKKGIASDIDEAKEYIVELKEDIETVKNETAEQRKRRIAKDGYLTDWFMYSERYYKAKAEEIV